MRRGSSILVACALLSLTFAGTASAAAPSATRPPATTRDCGNSEPLGLAGEFTEFIHHDAQRVSDSEGMVAYGGNAILGDAASGVGFSVGSGQAVDSVGPGLPLDPRTNRLIVGGAVHAHGVVVLRGAARVGSQAPGSQPIDALGPVTEGPPTLVGSLGTEIHFGREFAELTAKSNAWGDLAANGTVTSAGTGHVELTLEGAQAELNVFRLTKAQLEGASAIRIRVPAGSSILVNVEGTDLRTDLAPLATISVWDPVTGRYIVDDHFINGRPIPSEDWLRLRQSLLWNFPEATHLLKSEVSWPGTILAPRAHVELGRGTTVGPGHIDGHLIAASVTSAVGAETHYMPLLATCLPVVDPPLGALRVTKQLEGAVAGAARTFTVHLDCLGTAYDQDLRLTVPAGTTQTSMVVPDLPAGLVCTLEEPNVPAGWDLDHITPGTIVIRRDTTVEATVTNRRQVGSLILRKQLVGDPTDASRTFELHLDCQDDAFDQDVRLTVPIGSTDAEATVADLPVGLTCAVSEPTVDAGWELDSIQPTSVRIHSTTTPAAVTVRNRRRLGSLTIAKQVVGDPAPGTTDFHFAVDCTGTAYDAQVTVSVPGPPVTLPDLPLGLACQVSETDLPPGWTAETSSPVPVTVDDDPAVDATFTNRYTTGSLVIDKATTTAPTTDTTFTVRLDCDGTDHDQDVAVTVPAGTTSAQTAVGGLPVGIRCALSEVDLPEHWGEVSLTPQLVTVVAGAPAEVRVVNERDAAGLEIVKHLVGDPIGAPTTFTFDGSCDDGQQFTQVIGVPAGSTTESAVVGGLTPGTRCTVTESDPGPDWEITGSDSRTVTIDRAGTPVTADFTNTRRVASLRLSKSTEGDPLQGSTTFHLDLDCQGADYDQDVPLTVDFDRASADATIPGLPVGLACTVSEPVVPTGWRLVGVDPARVVIGSDPSVTVTNSLDSGTLRLTKRTVSATGEPLTVDSAIPFTLDVDCDGTDFDQDVTLTVAAGADAASRDLTGIPSGTTCNVTEVSRADWQLQDISPSSVVVTGDRTTTVTATNALRTGTLLVGKRVVGEPAPYDTTFGLRVDCTGTAHDRDLDVTVPGQGRLAVRTVPDLPYGTTCRLTEPTQPNDEWQPMTTVPAETTVGARPRRALLVARDTRPTGTLRITKRLSTGPARGTTAFTFRVDCQGTTYDADVVVTLAHPATREHGDYTHLPMSQSCAVTEAPQPGWTLRTSTDTAHVRPGESPAVFVNGAVDTHRPPSSAAARLPDTGLTDIAAPLLIAAAAALALGLVLLRRWA